jgi:molecular chaperone GrpE
MSRRTSGNDEDTGVDTRSDDSFPGEEPDGEAIQNDAPGDEGSPDDGSLDGVAGESPSYGSEDTRNELEREVARLTDQHLRLAAEFENYRKRVRNEQQETWARAQTDLMRRLVDSVDDLQRVALLDPDTATVQDIVQGVDLVERKMLRVLKDAGLEVLDPAGEDFDPRVMEAVMRAPAASEEEDDTVDMVLQRGYLMQGRLVRAARVSVRKHG